MRMKYLKIFLKCGGDVVSSIRTITSSSAVPDDLAKRLGPAGVNQILLIMWQGYYDLLADKNITITEHALEDDITLEWYGKIFQRWTSENRATLLRVNKIGPVHQYPDSTLKKDRGYKPTIDFCFRDWDTTNSYFGAECKNLYNNRKDKIRRYVETGVRNYELGRYGAQSSESSIIGYVLSGNISDIVKDLISEIASTSPVCNLSRELRYAEPQYTSKHKRSTDKSNITLHHLFFDFT